MKSFSSGAAAAARAAFGVFAAGSLIAAACAATVPARSASVRTALPCRQTMAVSGEMPQPVRWIEAEAAHREALDAWCTGVGPVTHVRIPEFQAPGPRPQAPGPSPHAPGPKPHALAIVSWNVNVGAGDLGAFVGDLLAGRFSDGRPIEHFVLLVQEALRTGPAVPPMVMARAGARRLVRAAHPVDVVRFAREAGLSLFYVPSMRNGMAGGDPAEDRGNAILSTLPLSELRAVELPFARQRRIAAVATLDETGSSGPITVASVHLDPFVSPRRLWLFGAAGTRGRQARAVADALPPFGPLVVGGDFNTWSGPDEPAVAEMMRITDHAPLPTRATFSNGLTLDYLFFRTSRSRYHVARSSYGSDHYPLIGWVGE